MQQPKMRMMAFAVLAVTVGSIQAEESPITISGFGTAALTMTDTDLAEYGRARQPSGVKRDPRTGVDSNFGIQATYRVNDSLSFTGQGLVRKIVNDHYGAELAWAFAKYKINSDFSVRIGRIGLPIYMISDFRNVGYANLALRPSSEVYRQVSLDSADGADVMYQHSFGETSVTSQLSVGKSRLDSAAAGHIDFKDIVSFNAIAEHGPFSVRAGYTKTKISSVGNTNLNNVLTALNAAGLISIADQLSISDYKGSFASLGATMDYQNFLVQTEYAKRKGGSRLLHDTSSWYAMAGYRFGKITPYYMHSTTKQDSIRNFAGLPTTGPNAQIAAVANTLLKTPVQTTESLGVRWDFYKSAAFKVQFDRVKPRDGNGFFINVKPGFAGPVNVYAAAVDFVF